MTTPSTTRSEELKDGFAACPFCKQYSHSIGEDQLTEAFNHFHTLIAHPVRGHPMGEAFDEKTRDAAQVLMAAALTPNPDDALREALEEVLNAMRPFANHVGKNGGLVTLRIGEDRWTGTLTTDDFKRLREARDKIAALASTRCGVSTD